MSGKMQSPWSNLKTKTNFDAGPDSFRGIFQLQLSELSGASSDLPFSFNSSMLIICLVEQLCSFIEKDAVKTRKLHDVFLQQLQDLGLVDGTCNSPKFGAMRQHFRKTLLTVVNLTQRIVNGMPASSLQLVPKDFDSVDLPCQNKRSRYDTDFEMLGFISRGGFGQVFRVRNRLDGCKYAIKKIFVRSQTDLYHSIINEVTVLARLQHPNIVKYYTAWLEPLECQEVPSIRIVEEESEVSFEESEEFQDGFVESKHYSLHSSSRIERRLQITEESSGSSYIQFRSESGSHSKNQVEELDSASSKKSRTSHHLEPSNSSSESSAPQAVIIPKKGPALPGRAVLYIQMELCGRSLRQWLDWRPVQADPSSMLGSLQLQTRFSCFWQLVAALEYLHDQGIVHHDIKPSNIFVFGNHRLKLGDFGLACSYENSKEQVHHSWGTCTYAAPEQLKGGLCNLKSDIFSTGLVLLELVMPPFQTNSERIHVIGQLREKGEVPHVLVKQLPLWSKLMCQLANPDPSARPSAKELKTQVEELICHNTNSQEHETIAPKSVIEMPTNTMPVVEEQCIETEIRIPLSPDVNFQSDQTSCAGNLLLGSGNVASKLHDELTFQSSKTFSSFSSSSSFLDSEFSRMQISHHEVLNNTLENNLQDDEAFNLLRIQRLELEIQRLKTELMLRDHQIKALKEQVRLLGLQLQT